MSDDVFLWLLVLIPALAGSACLYFGIQLLRPSRSTPENRPKNRAFGILMLALTFVCVCLTGVAVVLSLALNFCAGLGVAPDQPR